VDAAAAEGVTVLQVGAVLVAVALVIGGALWFWAWRTHGRPPEGPLERPVPPRPPRPPDSAPPSTPLGP
jgi:hypothetical protein